jgi:hypothetical protein
MSGFITGSIIQGYGANQAAKEQSRATDRATAAQAESARQSIEAQERMFGRQVELQEPFRQVGVNALPELVAASRYEPFTMEKFQADPGYAFRLKEGLRAMENSALASGMGQSGATLRGVTRYGQQLASDEFTNAFNRYQAERNARLNPLQSLTGMGQTTSQNIAGEAGQLGRGIASTYGRLGENIGSNIIQGGVARASGYAGMANAFNSGMSQYLAYQQNQARNQLDRDYINALNASRPVNNETSGYYKIR